MTELTPSNPSAPRYLWAAVGVLGAATIALGAVVLNPQWRSANTAPVAMESVHTTAIVASDAASAAQATPPVALHDSLGAKEAVVPPAASEPKSTPAPVKLAQAAPKKIVKKPTTPKTDAPAVTTEWPAEPTASPKAGKVVCAHCGTVQSVTPVQRDAAKGSGVGVLAGAALGGLLGNQVGGGTGKTVATVIGAVGGGWAGNEVEKRMKKVTVYEVTVRMQDGSTRNFEQSDAIAVGTAVTVEGDAIRLQTTPE